MKSKSVVVKSERSGLKNPDIKNLTAKNSLGEKTLTFQTSNEKLFLISLETLISNYDTTIYYKITTKKMHELSLLQCKWSASKGYRFRKKNKKIGRPVYVQMASTFRNKRQLDMCAID